MPFQQQQQQQFAQAPDGSVFFVQQSPHTPQLVMVPPEQFVPGTPHTPHTPTPHFDVR